MSLVLIVCVAALLVLIAFWIKRAREQKDLERHSITPQTLHELLAANQQVLVFDVRRPLDLLADSEIIPGAIRLPPKDVLENPSLIPKDKASVVYCTCPDDETSRAVLKRAKAMHLARIKFLKGGLAGWKAMGYPVERYEKSFHLDTRT